jgi:hypothetical protein
MPKSTRASTEVETGDSRVSCLIESKAFTLIRSFR